MKAILSSLAMLLVMLVNAQTIDLNKKDITKLKNFDGCNVSFFGLKPGMSRADAIKRLKTLKLFTWKFDTGSAADVNTSNPLSIQVSMKPGANLGGRAPLLMTLIWNKATTGMAEMQLHEIAYDFLVADTKRLTIFSEIDLNDSILGFLHDDAVKTTKDGFNYYSYAAQHFSYTVIPLDEKGNGPTVILSFFSKK